MASMLHPRVAPLDARHAADTVGHWPTVHGRVCVPIVSCWSMITHRLARRRHAQLSNRLYVMQIGRTIARRARTEPCGITDDAPQQWFATARAVCASQSSDVHLTAYAQASPDLRLELCERVPRSNLSGDLSILRVFGPRLS